MHPFKRSARVSDLIRQEVADIIMNKIKHKTLGFITVTGAKVSDDLRSATVYVSTLDEHEGDKVIRKLKSVTPVIRRELARRVKMKYLPSLSFKIDEAMVYGRKIDGILNELEKEGGTQVDDEDLF